MPDGIVEELFIAAVPATGVVEVWFRNWSVTANLGLRASGDLDEDPESVTWGQTKDRFVVRTGTTTATQKYYIFRIPRSAVIFGEGVIPSTTLERTVTPYTSGLSLGTVVVDLSETTGLRVSVNGATTITVALIGACTVTGVDTTLTGLLDGPRTVRTLSTTGTITLSTVLSAASEVRYGLDDSGALVLLVVGDVPSFTADGTQSVYTITTPCPGAVSQADSVVSLTASPRTGERHLWVVRIPGISGGTVLFTTVEGPLTLTNFLAGGAAEQERDAVTYAGAAACFGTAGCSNLIGGGGPVLDTLAITKGEQNTSGYSVRRDSLWDADIPFIVDNQYVTSSSAATNTGTSSHSAPTHYPATRWDWNLTWTTTTYTQDIPWTYRILGAYPIQLTTPLNFLLVVRRNRGSTREYGLFLRADVSWKTIRAFTAEPAGFNAFNVMTANERHAIWYIDADADTLYLTSLRNNVSKLIGTNLARMQSYRFRLIQGDIDDPADVLWKGEEAAGQFIDGWETNGNPTLVDTGAGFPLTWLDPWGRLADLPAGITPPVIPSG